MQLLHLNEEMINKLLQLIETYQGTLSTSFITLTPSTTEILKLSEEPRKG
jgi:hypothetical protein